MSGTPDVGDAEPRVVRALTDRAAGLTGWREVVAALAGSRLLAPLLEVASDSLEGQDAGDACAGTDRSMAAVTVRTEQGRLAMAFTGMPALTGWRPAARPLVVTAERVAGAALAESAEGLLLDAGSPHQVVVPPGVLRRIVAADPWPPAWVDPLVRDAVVRELAPALAAGMRIRLAPPDVGEHGPRAGLRVELAFTERLDQGSAIRRVERIAGMLSEMPELGELIDGDVEVAMAP